MILLCAEVITCLCSCHTYRYSSMCPEFPFYNFFTYQITLIFFSTILRLFLAEQGVACLLKLIFSDCFNGEKNG